MRDALLLAEDVEGTLSICDVDTGGRHTQALRGAAGTVPHRGVDCLGSDYVVAAYKEKPVLHVWAWTKHAQPVLRIPLPGKASAVACSPCGTFCVCGIDASFYIWEVASGRLLSVVSHHFQAISVLRFTDEGSVLLSGGRDGHVHAWSFSSVLSRCHRGETPEPLFTWTDHQLPVTDIYCGTSGRQARVFTVSKDSTCQVYELSFGRLLCTMVFESSLLAIALDLVELFLFGAEEKENIIRKVFFHKTEYHTTQQATDVDTEESNGKSPNVVCRGHTGLITSLSVTGDGTTLVSASDDGTARLWQTTTCQCLQVINRQGPVGFARFVRLPAVLLNHRAGANPRSQLLAPLALFQRQLATTEAKSSSVAALESCSLQLNGLAEHRTKWPLQGKQRTDYWKKFLWSCAKVDQKTKADGGSSAAVKSSTLVKSLQHQLSEMHKVKQQLLRQESQQTMESLGKS